MPDGMDPWKMTFLSNPVVFQLPCPTLDDCTLCTPVTLVRLREPVSGVGRKATLAKRVKAKPKSARVVEEDLPGDVATRNQGQWT